MPRGVEKILVIKLSALGDFVLALAAMKKIREAHRKAHITLLTKSPFEGPGQVLPILQRVDTGGRATSLSEWIALRRRLKQRGTAGSMIYIPRPNRAGYFTCCGPIRRPGQGSPSAALCRTPIRCATRCTPWSDRPTN